MTITKREIGFAALVLAALVAILIQFSTAYGHTTLQQPIVDEYRQYTFFASSTSQTSFATTTSATSTRITTWTDSNGTIDKGYFVVAGAKKVSMFFGRGDTTGQGNSGSTNFRVQITDKANPSESDWIYYNTLYQNLATSTAETTLSSVTISAATSTVMVSLDPADTVYAVRCIAVETTDGEHSCRATATW